MYPTGPRTHHRPSSRRGGGALHRPREVRSFCLVCFLFVAHGNRGRMTAERVRVPEAVTSRCVKPPRDGLAHSPVLGD